MPRRFNTQPGNIERPPSKPMDREAPAGAPPTQPLATRGMRAQEAQARLAYMRTAEAAENEKKLQALNEQLVTIEGAARGAAGVAELRKRKGADAKQVKGEAAAPETRSPETKDERAEARLALTEAARVRVHFIKRAIEQNKLTDENSWEFLHQLRSRELELEAALQESWQRPNEELDLAWSKAERRALVDALLEVQDALGGLRSRVEARQAQTDFEDSYAVARVQAFEKYAADMARARDIRDRTAHDQLSAEQRRRYADLFRSRVGELEQELVSLDALPPAEATGFEHAAAYEAASETLKGLRETLHELARRQAEEEERLKQSEQALPPKTPAERELELAREPRRGGPAPREGHGVVPAGPAREKPFTARQKTEVMARAVEQLARNVNETLDQGRMTEDWRDQALIELSKVSGDLEDRLRYLQTEATESAQVQAERARIAETLHLIDDERGRLHAFRVAGEAAPESIRSFALSKELRSKERAIKDLERRTEALGRQVKNVYGREPEDILAGGGLGFAGFLKRALGRVTGHDPYGEWRRSAARLDDLQKEIETAYVGRPATREAALGKARARGTAEEVEQMRIENQQTAKAYREAQWLPKPTTEEEFFGGTLEEPRAEIETAADMRIKATLTEAAGRGISDAETIYGNLLGNPAVELLSFTPEEYVRQLGIVAEARSDQGGKKGRERFTAKKRFNSALGVLAEMRRELLDYGFNPETGGDLHAARVLESPGMRDVERRKRGAARRGARRKTGAGSVFIEAS